METTGLADPAPVLFTLAADPALRHKFERGMIVTTFDAVHGLAQLLRHPEARKQIAVADRIVLTKTDLDAAALTPASRRDPTPQPGSCAARRADATTPAALLEQRASHSNADRAYGSHKLQALFEQLMDADKFATIACAQRMHDNRQQRMPKS